MIYKINPEMKEYIWAGRKLKNLYNKESTLEKISETWEFSINDSGISNLQSLGSLKDYMKSNNIGKNLKFEDVKLLIKLIDADSDLSIQVHPSDNYALNKYNKLGKTEMWYIIDSEKDAYLYLGFNDNYDKDTVIEHLNNGTITDLLNKVYVKPGDFFKIPSGTIHAIGKGITLYEIQENSDLTFRLYDYDRLDKNGEKRELHINESIEVLDYSKYDLSYLESKNQSKVLTANEYFELINFYCKKKYTIKTNENSFSVITIIKGNPTINGINFKLGDTIYADPSETLKVEGDCNLLLARIPDLAVGLDVGGTSIKGIMIDDLGFKIHESKVVTESEKGEDQITLNMAKSYNLLLEKSGIREGFFKKLGIGFPGNINPKEGIVVFSNNLGLKNYHLKEKLEKEIGVEVLIDNDANCAALGEYFYTDKKKLDSMVLITLGTGVGSGVILDSKLFTGGMHTMVELGHMKVKSDKVKCTCGQYGCFESLLSLSRLKMDIDALRESDPELKELIKDTDTPLKIFSFDETNETAKEYCKKYQNNLLLGLENICNIFQPEIIAIGGGVSYLIAKYLPSLEYRMNKYKYAGFDAPKVRLEQAKLGNEAGGYGACALTKM